MEEVEALEAIFCLPGEVNIIRRELPIMLDVNLLEVGMTVGFVLDDTYPECSPQISIRSPFLINSQAERLKNECTIFAKNLQGQAMLMDIILWIQDNLGKYLPSRESQSLDLASAANVYSTDHIRTIGKMDAAKQSWISIIRIDHMRSQTKYVKTISKWMQDLQLTGCLIFCGRTILLIVQGERGSIKNYLTKHKTSIVDVDSRGLPCKEKMMSVLMERPLENHIEGFKDFQVYSDMTWQAVEKLFLDQAIGEFYETFVKHLDMGNK